MTRMTASFLFRLPVQTVTVPLSTQFTRRVFTSCNYFFFVLFPYNDIIQVSHLVQILQLSQYLPLSLCVLV